MDIDGLLLNLCAKCLHDGLHGLGLGYVNEEVRLAQAICFCGTRTSDVIRSLWPWWFQHDSNMMIVRPYVCHMTMASLQQLVEPQEGGENRAHRDIYGEVLGA